MKKRVFIILLFAMMVFSLSACGSLRVVNKILEVAADMNDGEEDGSSAGEESTHAEYDFTSGSTAEEDWLEFEQKETDEAENEKSKLADFTALTTGQKIAIGMEGFSFYLPEGYEETTKELYFMKNDASTIYAQVLPNDDSFASVRLLKGKGLLIAVKKEIEDTYGHEVEPELLQEEFFEIDGRQAFYYAFTYDFLDTPMLQIQCIVEGEESLYFLTYSGFTYDDCYERFMLSIKSACFEEMEDTPMISDDIAGVGQESERKADEKDTVVSISDLEVPDMPLGIAVNIGEEGFVFQLPEGYAESDIEYYYEDMSAPESGSNILVQVVNSKGVVDSYIMIGAEGMLTAIKAQLETLYGVEVTPELRESVVFSVPGGNRAFMYSMTYDLLGMPIVQIQCVVEGEEASYVLTYSGQDDEMDYNAFMASVVSIRFE